MKTANFEENEIVRADDLQYGFDSQFTNLAKIAKAIICQNKDFVAGGKITKGSGLTINIDPIIGVAKSSNKLFVKNTVSYAAIEAGSEGSRIDTVILKMDLVKDTESQQKRAKISKTDGNTNIVVYDDIYTKKNLSCEIEIIKGDSGSAAAKEKTIGSIKLAEIVVPANASSIAACTIYPVENEFEDGENENWTIEKDVTVKVDNLVDNKKIFREEHNQDGSHKDNSIHLNNIDIGGGVNQLSAKTIPVGAAIGTTVSADSSIFDAIKGGNSYTFIVDSDEALLTWGNNIPGNDYTSVLIKKGEYNLPIKEINLENIGTKYIFGEYGSVLKLQDISNPSDSIFNNGYNCYFYNLKILSNVTGDYIINVFNNCKNIYNCEVLGIFPSNDRRSSCIFYNCENIQNCIASCGGSHAYYGCKDICNCITDWIQSCENISSCKLKKITIPYGESNLSGGLYSCKNIINVTIEGLKPVSVPGGLINNCSYLTNVIAIENSSSSEIYACDIFSNCNHIVNCHATKNNGYGTAFNNCKHVICCSGKCTYGNPFIESYSTQNGESYICADTPNGGFNRTLV